MPAGRPRSDPPCPRLRRSPAARPAALALALLAGSCCLTPATRLEVAAHFRTPEQTVETFQRGMLADQPAVEFRCLAVEFVQRHGLSELAYREFRQASGWVRLGVGRAEIVEREELAPDRVRLAMRTSGPLGTLERSFEVELLRESFWEAFAGERRVADELAEDLAELLELVDGPYGPVLLARIALPHHLDPRLGGDPITELRLGAEWKIADLHLPEPAEPRPGAPGPTALAPRTPPPPSP